MFSLKKKQRREVRRITEYLISGGAFFWSGYIAFFVFDKGLHLSLWWATSLAYLIGWTINFLLQRYWVFDNPKLSSHAVEVSERYIIISIINWPINYAILWSLKNVDVSPYIGQFVSAGFFTFWNYIWYKLWVFAPSYTPKRNLAKRRKK